MLKLRGDNCQRVRRELCKTIPTSTTVRRRVEVRFIKFLGRFTPAPSDENPALEMANTVSGRGWRRGEQGEWHQQPPF